jgi:hypothetical protein
MLASQGRSAVMASKEEEDEDDDDEEELEDEIEESDPNSMSVADSIALVAADSSCRRPARSKAELQRRRDMGTGGSKGTVAICQEGATRVSATRGRRQSVKKAQRGWRQQGDGGNLSRRRDANGGSKGTAATRGRRRAIEPSVRINTLHDSQSCELYKPQSDVGGSALARDWLTKICLNGISARRPKKPFER